MRDLAWLTAAEIGAAYAARRLSPVELVQALIGRIEADNRGCGAFISVDAEGRARRRATGREGDRRGRSLGPLHGVPLRHQGQHRRRRAADHLPLQDPARQHRARGRRRSVANLRAAGAILLGKQALHEFAFGGPSKDLPFPYARHPWNTAYHPGGSSSGSGVALAAGMVPLSIGTDAGGSIRNPAGNCGVVGLKPTYGLISRRGAVPGRVHARSRRTDGALGRRHRADARRRGRPRSAVRVTAPVSRAACAACASVSCGAGTSRLGRRPRGACGARRGRAGAGSEGADVRDVALAARLQEMAAVHRVILLAETWAVHAKWLRERPEDYTLPTRRKVMPGAFLSAGDYVHGAADRRWMIAAVDDALRDVDVLLTASGMDPPFRIDDAKGLALHLSAPGPQPVQSHRASRHRDDERRVETRRTAAVGAVRRPRPRRGHAAAGRCRLRARDAMERLPPVQRPPRRASQLRAPSADTAQLEINKKDRSPMRNAFGGLLRPRGLPRSRLPPGAGLSDQTHPHHRAVRGRRRHRSGRPHGRAEAQREVGPAGDRREPRRRRRQSRRRGGVHRRAGRLHAAVHRAGAAGRQPDAVRQA